MKHLNDIDVLVLGLGESGLAMARWCERHGARVRVWDSRDAAPGDAVVALVKELNDYGETKLKELARDLAAVNAAQLRALIAQIESGAPFEAQQRALAILNASLKG